MILINSSAYLQGEFASELGLLPPSLLPIGNKRLFQHQIDFLRNFDSKSDVFISLPKSYSLNFFDEFLLKKLDIKIIFVPDNFSLCEAILFCWNSTTKNFNNLTLLHGDTLFINSFLKKNDLITVHSNKGFYKRAKFNEKSFDLKNLKEEWSNNFDNVVSGFFNFNNPLLFIKCLQKSNNDFIKGVSIYNKNQELKITSTGVWLDFGHINSFFHSRSWITTQRSFNELKIDSRVVKKKSKVNSKKIIAEGKWFQNIPPQLRLYTPQFLGLNENLKNSYYKIEYLYLLPLSDLYVFCNLKVSSWENIFNQISSMLKDFSKYKPNKLVGDSFEQMNQLYQKKTLKRLNEFFQQENIKSFNYNIDELQYIVYETSKYIKSVTFDDVAVVHGDLCFSNLLFDTRSEGIKCIDPRGLNNDNEFSIYGDRRYDIAKLYHSVFGLYDFIIAGRFSFKNNCNTDIIIDQKSNSINEIAKKFNTTILEPFGYSEKEILAITIQLFISMLPLHSDEPKRQEAFIENTFRLFLKFKLL